MNLRVAILALLVITGLGVLVFRSLPQSSMMGGVREASTTAPEATEALAPVAADTSLRFEVIRERVLTPYRAPLDRRVALAVSEVRRLSGSPDSTLTTQFTAGRWVLRFGSQEVGTLSELPDYGEVLDLLTEWARKHAWARNWSGEGGPERPDLERALERLDAPAALREADRAWTAGARDAGLFRDAARAYALLALETPDGGGMTDAILARSLSTLAYARALGAEDPKREACWLAAAMGYSAAARKQAEKLAPRDPLRLYVLGHRTALQQAAAAATSQTASAAAVRKAAPSAKATTTKPKPRPKTPPAPVRLEAAFLHLLDLASRNDYEGWAGLLPAFDRPGVPMTLVLGTGTRIEPSEASSRVVAKLHRAMARPPAGRKKGGKPAAPETPNLVQHLQRFEAAIEGQTLAKGGPLFSADFARAQQRSIAYAAVDRLARHSLESLSPPELSRWFAKPSSKRRAAKRIAAFQRWYAHLADARAGRPDLAALRADVDSMAPGATAALRSHEALRAILAADDPTLRVSARSLFRRLDSRPEHRAVLATIAERDLGALSVAERLGASAAEGLGSTDGQLLVWQMRFKAPVDTARGRGAATMASRAPSATSDSLLGATLARRLTATPRSWEAAERYARWLEGRRNVASARRVLERWVTRTLDDSSLAPLRMEARTQIARLHQLEGHPTQGLELLSELHRSGHFGAMGRTALILQDLGQPNQALAIAWAAHRRHPRLAAGHALLAELFWRQGRYDDAAKALRDGRPKPSRGDWSREIAPRFAACFRTRGAEGLQAAEALVRAGFTDRATLGALPEALGAEGLHALAFELQSRIQLTGAQQVESAVLAYGHLKRAKGEGTALQWIRTRVPEKDRLLLGVFAHQEGHPELLWTMSPSRLSGELGDFYWLLRTATCMQAGSSHRRHAETEEHLRRARGAFHLEVARYLFGLRQESEVLALARTQRDRSELAYFAGLKAESSGRLRDAADWYLISVESGDLTNAESRWAAQRLRIWGEERWERSESAPAQPPPA